MESPNEAIAHQAKAAAPHRESAMFTYIKKIFYFIFYGANDYNKTLRDARQHRHGPFPNE